MQLLPSNAMVMDLNLCCWNALTMAVYTGGRLVYECTGSVQCGRVNTVSSIFL